MRTLGLKCDKAVKFDNFFQHCLFKCYRSVGHNRVNMHDNTAISLTRIPLEGEAEIRTCALLPILRCSLVQSSTYNSSPISWWNKIIHKEKFRVNSHRDKCVSPFTILRFQNRPLYDIFNKFNLAEKFYGAHVPDVNCDEYKSYISTYKILHEYPRIFAGYRNYENNSEKLYER